MRVTVNGYYQDVDLARFNPRYTSGIEWRDVGSYYRPVDRGASYENWASDITVTGTENVIRNLRWFLVNSDNKEPIFMNLDSWEHVFGSEFFFPYAYSVPCFLDKSSLSLVTNAGQDGVVHSLSFTLLLARYSDVNSYNIDSYLVTTYSGLDFGDLGLYLKSINRIGNRDFSGREMETTYNGFGFGTEQLLTECVYTAQNYRDDNTKCKIGTAKRWFEVQRNNIATITNSNAKNYLFDIYGTSQNAYVIDISEGEYSNGKNILGTLKITYGKA